MWRIFPSHPVRFFAYRFFIALLIVSWLFSGWPPIWNSPRLPSLPREAQAANFSIQTGSYIGNGTTLSISGLGFKPEFLIITSDNTTVTSLFKTSAMPENNTAFFSATADNYANQVVFQSDGFTVGNREKIYIDEDGFSVVQNANLTIENVRYNWVAFAGSDCSASGTFCVGAYTGNGSATQTITTGFEPAFVMVKRSTAVAAHFRTVSQPDNETLFFLNLVRNTAGAYIQTFSPTGFTVGATDNTQGGSFYYVAFKSVAGVMDEGTYTADNTDNRSITGVGFQPNFVFVKNATNATANNTHGVFNITQSFGDSSSFFAAVASAVNNIQALEADGFQVGTTLYVNGSATDTHYYVAFGGATTPSASGTFTMQSGTYTGNGTGQNITGLTFEPDLVIIKDNAANNQVFRTRLMGGNSTAYFSSATANFDGGILSLNSAGFTIGPSLVVNTSGNTYHWQAFGNAYNPHTKSGAADFAIGAYYGNGIDNRSITSVPFAPDMVVVKAITNAGAATWRPSTYTYDSSLFFANTASSSNGLQALTSDGFELGTAGTVNTSAVIYFWYAFKDGSNFTVNAYRGNGADNRDITGVGFQPDLVWTKAVTNQYGVSRPSTLAGDSSQYFYNAANAADRIQSLAADGFQVGANAQVNTNNVDFYYCAWATTTAPVGRPDIPGTPSFSNTTATSTTISWSAAANTDYYEIERAKEFASFTIYTLVATTSALSYTNSGLTAATAYNYRVRGVNGNGPGTFSAVNQVTTSAQSFAMQTGYYIGNGGTVSLSGLGFSPEFLMIKSNTAASAAVFVTAAMRDSNLASLINAADNAVANINTENVPYQWTAFAGSDCSASGTMCVGSYTGDGAATQTITTGFAPAFVIVKRSTAVAAHFRTASQPDNETLFFQNVVRNTAGAYIQTFSPTGFTVGATDNVAQGIYYYIAFKSAAGVMNEGTYTADNTDNRSITGVGFKPNFVLVKNATNATANNTYATFNAADSYGDSSSYFTATANGVNNIQTLESDGFQVGTSFYVNGSATDTHYYVAFGGVSTPSAIGTFSIETGVYSGDDSGSRSISGLGFSPDLVIIKNESNTQSVFRTRLMGGNSTAYHGVATANFDGGILSLDPDGFTIGAGPTVNAGSNTYHWQAFGNAYNPHTKSGAADFAIGAYYGNGIDDRDITGVPFAPDMVVVKANAAYSGVWRPSTYTYDSSLFFINTASSSDYIQALNSDGFQVGVGSRNVNYLTYINFWYAFKNGSNFTVNTYRGNGADNRDITGVGFQPDLVWTKAVTNQYGVSRPSTLAGDSSQYFYNAANAADRIQSLAADGFQVGANAQVNTNNVDFYYCAWRKPVAAVVSITLDRDAFNYGLMGYNTASSTLTLWGGAGITATNDGNVTEDFDIYGSNTADWVLMGAVGSDQFVHQFCNDTDADCTSPPTGYTALTTNPQTLKTAISPSGSVVFQLRLITPDPSTVNTEQSTVVTIQASQ